MIKFNAPELQKIYDKSPAFIKTRAESLKLIDADVELLQNVLREEKIAIYRDYWCNAEGHYLKWVMHPGYDEWYITIENRQHSLYYGDVRFIDAHPLIKLALYPYLPHLYKMLLAMSDYE